MSLKNQSAIENNNAFMVKIEDLVKEILIQNSMPYYRVESGMEMEQAGENGYRPVIRIITYFEDTVSKISDILHSEFDLINIQPQKKGSGLDTFSYKRVQYLAALKMARQGLTEYKRSAGKKFEIQVSSMLQDAWVGIEKELGYDSVSISEDVKRDFYRVGALLEMADIEFLKIRSQLGKKGTSFTPPQPASSNYTEHLQPAATVAEPAKEAKEEQPKEETAAVRDTNADSYKAPEANVTKIEEKNNIAAEAVADIVNIAPIEQAAPEKIVETSAPVAEAPAASEVADSALHTDRVHTFNTSVNSTNEKTPDHVNEYAASSYQEPTKAAYANVDENAPMTDASLKEYVLNSKALKEVDMQIAERAGAKLNPEIDVEGDVDRLKFLKVFTLKQLHERITDNSADIVAFAEKWIGKDNGGSFDSGICLFYLEYLLVGKKNDPAFAIEYVVKFISDNDYSARYIIPTYNSIRNAEPTSSHAHLTLK